jgi:hypothetical protein
MGYKDRSAILVLRANTKSTSPTHYDSTIIYEGQIIGTWKRTITKTSIDLDFEFTKPLTKNQSLAFDHAINRLGEFTNLTVNYGRKKTASR